MAKIQLIKYYIYGLKIIVGELKVNVCVRHGHTLTTGPQTFFYSLWSHHRITCLMSRPQSGVTANNVIKEMLGSRQDGPCWIDLYACM